MGRRRMGPAQMSPWSLLSLSSSVLSTTLARPKLLLHCSSSTELAHGDGVRPPAPPRPVPHLPEATAPQLHSRPSLLLPDQPPPPPQLPPPRPAPCRLPPPPPPQPEGGGGGGWGYAVGAKDWRLLAWYLLALDKHPVATKAVTSAVLTLAGDLICQLVIDKLPELDLKRTFAFTFPGLVLTVFSALVTLEAWRESPLVAAKLRQEWLSSVFVNWQLWIPFQFLNFYFVPQKLQVLAANFVALAWNVILSFKAHKEVVTK